jgi:hypothetical protein
MVDVGLGEGHGIRIDETTVTHPISEVVRKRDLAPGERPGFLNGGKPLPGKRLSDRQDDEEEK